MKSEVARPSWVLLSYIKQETEHYSKNNALPLEILRQENGTIKFVGREVISNHRVKSALKIVEEGRVFSIKGAASPISRQTQKLV